MNITSAVKTDIHEAVSWLPFSFPYSHPFHSLVQHALKVRLPLNSHLTSVPNGSCPVLPPDFENQQAPALELCRGRSSGALLSNHCLRPGVTRSLDTGSAAQKLP